MTEHRKVMSTATGRISGYYDTLRVLEHELPNAFNHVASVRKPTLHQSPRMVQYE